MKNILILGGTGRLGQMLTAKLAHYHVTTLARRAAPGRHIQADICEFTDYSGFDTVIHCAAMKDAPKCELDVETCIAANTTGTSIALKNAARYGVSKFIYISTDMAVKPQSVYGASKKLADALVVNAAREGTMETAVIRFGNIISRQGSILTLIADKAHELGYVPVTDARMTRFMMRADDCADFVMKVAQRSVHGEIFVPRCNSYRILDVAEAVAPGVPVKIIGLRPGDALKVTMIAHNEVYRTVEEREMYRIVPVWSHERPVTVMSGELDSSNNPLFASIEELRILNSRP